MTTKGNLVKSTIKDSDETFEYCCSTCNENRQNEEAKKYCRECAAYFCEGCLQHHNKFPALRNHIITDTAGQIANSEARVGVATEDLPKCPFHHFSPVAMFCKDHEEICCKTCVAVKHRTCKKTADIGDAAKDVRNSSKYKTTKECLTKVLSLLQEEKMKQTDILSSLCTEQDQLIESVDSYREELIARINELAETSKTQISIKYQAKQNGIHANLTTLDTVIESTTQISDCFTTGSEILAFIQMNLCAKVIEEGEQLLQDLANQNVGKELKQTVNRAINGNLMDLETLLCQVQDHITVKEYKAVPCAEVITKSTKGDITGLCMLDDGKIIAVNNTRETLVRLDENLREMDAVLLNDNAVGLYLTGPNEVGTCLWRQGKVQIVTTNKTLTCASVIKVGSQCFGLCYISERDELVVSCGSRVKVIKKGTGSVLQSIVKDENHFELFSSPKLCAYDDMLKLLLVADYNKGLVALKEGQLQWIYTDTELRHACGVCVLPGEVIIVCEESSNNIVQIDTTGKKIKILIKDMGSFPYSMAYDQQKSWLFIGCENGLKVFNLTPQ